MSSTSGSDMSPPDPGREFWIEHEALIRKIVHRELVSLQAYQGGEWKSIPPDHIFIQARTPDGLIELSIPMLAALLAPAIAQQIRDGMVRGDPDR